MDFGFITLISNLRLQVNASLNKLWINYLRYNGLACADPEVGLGVWGLPFTPSLAHQRNAIEMALRWRANDGLLCLLGICLLENFDTGPLSPR